MFSLTTIKIMRLSKDAKLPTKARKGDACWDLYSVSDWIIPAWQGAIIPTGINIELPKDWMGQIFTRSGHGFKGIRVHLGIIDSGYRGDISPYIMNHTPNIVQFKKGDRIAQLFFMPVPKVQMKEVNFISNTERGTNGKGSTGR